MQRRLLASALRPYHVRMRGLATPDLQYISAPAAAICLVVLAVCIGIGVMVYEPGLGTGQGGDPARDRPTAQRPY